MAEIFDSLLCALGQDVLDALYWTMRTNPWSYTFLFQFVFAMGYVAIHSILFFLHLSTMIVAVNSADKLFLVTLMISNNFAEIKTSVFKKFDAANLFKLACRDVTERFKLFLFMLLTMGVNLMLIRPGESFKVALVAFRDQFVIVFGFEVVADFVKHCFIAKGNGHSPELYVKFLNALVRDVTETRHDENGRGILDHTHILTHRLGLAQLPLACVFARFSQDIWTRAFARYPASLPDPWRLAIILYIGLIELKILTGIVLTGMSAKHVMAQEQKKFEAAKGRRNL
eukprot:CAMPEP_0185754512 /NCGR_PEP_ID=MMETSP1174-20130828/13160_1 /TAXON_ID=35687 /ORGANISM="Dictyocha speculum, Strain CCMP1381" /LENGTH=284 /DNA_ID=CAMNT_0028432763 /DNA_START=334 /DNA_END=1189 /DNA_ORIENTATION=-